MYPPTLPQNKFDTKRPGSLIGTITAVTDYLRMLFAMINQIRDSNNEASFTGYVICSTCNKPATTDDIDPDRMIAPELSLKNGAVLLWAGTHCRPVAKTKELARMIGIDFAKPLAEQDKRFIDILLYGYDKDPVTSTFKGKQQTAYYIGCVSELRYMINAGTKSKGNIRAIQYFSKQVQCEDCNGSKMNSEVLATTIQDRSIADVLRTPVSELLLFIRNLPDSLDAHELEITTSVRTDIETRLSYLNKIGLKYL